ncbi:hypothetical protein Droror1_Dr00023544 [Drosera rotundifolia]
MSAYFSSHQDNHMGGHRCRISFVLLRFFSVGCIYGRNNDAQRFDFFCHAALEFLQQSGFHLDIIHCHDWSTAPVAWLFKDHYVQYGLTKTRVVFTFIILSLGLVSLEKPWECR